MVYDYELTKSRIRQLIERKYPINRNSSHKLCMRGMDSLSHVGHLAIDLPLATNWNQLNFMIKKILRHYKRLLLKSRRSHFARWLRWPQTHTRLRFFFFWCVFLFSVAQSLEIHILFVYPRWLSIQTLYPFLLGRITLLATCKSPRIAYQRVSEGREERVDRCKKKLIKCATWILIYANHLSKHARTPP